MRVADGRRLRGLTWDHPRGYVVLDALTAGYARAFVVGGVLALFAAVAALALPRRRVPTTPVPEQPSASDAPVGPRIRRVATTGASARTTTTWSAATPRSPRSNCACPRAGTATSPTLPGAAPPPDAYASSFTIVRPEPGLKTLIVATPSGAGRPTANVQTRARTGLANDVADPVPAFGGPHDASSSTTTGDGRVVRTSTANVSRWRSENSSATRYACGLIALSSARSEEVRPSTCCKR